jgi:AraC-like DNA-binding protein
MFIVKKPVYPLDKYVKGIIIYESLPNLAQKGIRASIVDGCPLMMFHCKEPLKCKNNNNEWISHPQQCLIGQKKSFIEIESGNENMIVIVFYPDGLRPVIKIPVNEITGLLLDSVDVCGSECKEIQEKLCEIKDNDTKIKLIEQFLLRAISSNKYSYDNELRYAIDLMTLNSNTRIVNLASEVNMSKRNFERKFIESVGVSPVFLNRITRFQKTINFLYHNGNMSFTQLAHDAGYFDQSHFTRDFKTFYGHVPKKFNLDQIVFNKTPILSHLYNS